MSLIDSIVTSVNCERVNDAFEIIYVLLDGALPIKTGECCESKWTKNKRRTANIRPFARIFAGLWVIFFHPLSLSLTLSLFVVYSTNWKYFLWRPDHAKRRIGRVFMIFAIFSLLSHADPKWQDVICILGGHEIGGGNRRIACVYSPLFISNTLSLAMILQRKAFNIDILQNVHRKMFISAFICECVVYVWLHVPFVAVGLFSSSCGNMKEPSQIKATHTHSHVLFALARARALLGSARNCERDRKKYPKEYSIFDVGMIENLLLW